MADSAWVMTTIFCLAFLIPLTAAGIPRLRMPSAVLEILAGIALGHSGLHLISTPDWLHDVTNWGLLNLLFLSGMELRLPNSRAPSTQASTLSPLWGAMLYTTATIAGALWISRLFASLHLTQTPNITVLMLATTSLGIVMPTLKDANLLAKPFGQMLLLSAFFADFLTVFSSGFIFGKRTLLTGGIAIAGILAAAVITFFIGKWLLHHLNLSRLIVRRSELGVRGAYAIMAVFGTLASLLGAEVMLGGFVGGVTCSLLAGNEHEVLRTKLETISYALFLPIFFITVGLELDFHSFHERALLLRIPLYLLAALFVKMIAALVWKPFFPWPRVIAAGWLMSTRFTLVIALALLAGEAHLISGTEISTWTVTALLTVFLAPWLFNLTLPNSSKGGD